MSSRAIQLLEESRLQKVVEQIEAGKPVDVKKVETLQAFDLVRQGQLFLADALRREDEAHERLAATIGS